MSITAARVQTPRPPGGEVRSVSEITFDSSYPTGGEPVTPADLGLKRVDFAVCTISAVAKEVNVSQAHYDTTNKKIKLFNETPAEVANEADVAGVKVQVVAYGH